jgi:hypothetical protein
MQTKGQGLLASLLMFIPLLAVPFEASFGVPWLAAKAKDEGLPVPDLASPSSLEPGVGQSQSAKHSAEDLFAPVAKPAAVDLRLASSASPATVQNPHLRNASLIITHNEGWVDPFENMQASPAQKETGPAENVSPQAPENPLDGWELNDEQTEPAANDAPLPRESFESQSHAPEPTASANPFAEFEGNPPPAVNGSEAQVAVLDNAFEDPIESPMVNSNPKSFNPKRPLFNESANTPKFAPTEPAIRAQNPAPATVAANSGNNVREAVPLTWETARARLKELGITDYYVQPNATGELFHFRCSYAPPNNPRITRLFEAEAAEPLEAVRKVLVQVENWTQRQTISPN